MAQEAIHSVRNKKGEVGFLAIKVDLENAYDRLRWEFIRDTPIVVGLPDDLVNLYGTVFLQPLCS